MENFKQCPLFEGHTEEEIAEILDFTQPQTRTYRTGEYLFTSSDFIHEIGIIIQGRIHLISEDFWGNQFILTEYRQNHAFGEGHSLISDEPLLFSIVAQDETTVVFFSIEKIMDAFCSPLCHRRRLLQNLLKISAQKKILLLHKIEHMSRKSLREKIISYLSEQAKKQNSSIFDIPYNRQEMADFLSVDRSAMSSELGKMQREGLIVFHRNHFELQYRP